MPACCKCDNQFDEKSNTIQGVKCSILCKECCSEESGLITKTNAKALSVKDFSSLNYKLVRNPHCKSQPCTLYIKSEIEYLATEFNEIKLEKESKKQEARNKALKSRLATLSKKYKIDPSMIHPDLESYVFGDYLMSSDRQVPKTKLKHIISTFPHAVLAMKLLAAHNMSSAEQNTKFHYICLCKYIQERKKMTKTVDDDTILQDWFNLQKLRDDVFIVAGTLIVQYLDSLSKQHLSSVSPYMKESIIVNDRCTKERINKEIEIRTKELGVNYAAILKKPMHPSYTRVYNYVHSKHNYFGSLDEVLAALHFFEETRNNSDFRRDHLATILKNNYNIDTIRRDSKLCKLYIDGSIDMDAEEVGAVIDLTSRLFSLSHKVWSNYHLICEEILRRLHYTVGINWKNAVDLTMKKFYAEHYDEDDDDDYYY